MSGTSWVTLATNDSYSLGALVLGHSLHRVGTVHHLTVLITPGVTQPMRDKLSKVFNTVKEVNVLDSQDQGNLALLSRPELGITFTKLNCWRLTQFSKGVFLDADTLVLQNCDELFDREELSAAPDAGWPDCFNSGVFVFRPSEATYQALIQFAVTNGSFDGGDQGLLNLFFADWATKDISRHLPFIYNMVSTATYSYLPAFKQFGSNVKIAHFIGAAKPWLQYFDTESQKVTPPPSSTHLQGLLQIWWDIFCSQVHPDLSRDMNHRSPPEARLDTTYTPHIINPSPPSNFFSPSEEQDIRDHITDPWESYSESTSSEQQSKFTQYSENFSRNTHTTQTQILDTEVLESRGIDSALVDNISDNDTECSARLTECEQHIANQLLENFHLDSRAHNTDFINYNSDNNYNQESCAALESICIKYCSDTSSLISSTLDTVEEQKIENQQSPILNSQYYTSCEDKHVEITSVSSDRSRVASDSINPTESGCDPKAAETDSAEAGLAGALAQLTLGVPRSAEQTALEEHLRRQSWEQGNADYMGRDSFDNIWKKISETLAQVPEPKVEENKRQDVEARIAEPTKITEVPLSQPAPPEFISELKLQCTEPKVESTPTNSECTSPVTSAAPVDKESVVSSNVTDTTLEKNPEEKLSVHNVESTNQSSDNIVTETIPTFISEYPPIDQTILSDSPSATELNETQNITQPLKDIIPTNTEKLKDISSATIQEKDNEKSESFVATEILESASVPSLPQESLITNDQQPLPKELGKATILNEIPMAMQVPIAGTEVADPTISSPIVSSPPESSQSEVKCEVDQKLDVKEPIASTEQIILSQTTELPLSATESPLPVNVITNIEIPSQADSSQTLPTVLSGSELLSTLTSAGISPTILESSGIQIPIDQPPFVKLSDIIQPQQPETLTELCDEKGVPAVPDLVPVIEIPESSPVTTPSIESTGLQDAVGSASDSTMKSTEPDSAPQTPDSPTTKPVSTALVAVPKKRPGKLPEPPKPTIALPGPDSASTPPISSQPPLDIPSSTDAQIFAANVISAGNSENVLLSPILPSPEVKEITEAQSTLIQNDVQPPIVEESVMSVQEKPEITSQAPATDQVSKEADKPQTPTGETKITLENKSPKESVLSVQEKNEITSQTPEAVQQVSKEADKPQTPTGETKITLEKQLSKENILSAQEKTEITSQAPETVQQVSKEADKPQAPTGQTKITLEKQLSKESVLSAQEKTERTSQAPETDQNKQDSKEADKPKTPTEATKITLEKQSSNEEKQGGKLSGIDSKPQTKPSKVVKQSSKEAESPTKPDVIQPTPTTEPTPVKPKPKGLKGPKGPKSPPIKDAPQTPPPAKDVPQTPPPIKGAPQTPTVIAATPPISPISTPLTSPNSESLKVDQTQPGTPPVTSTTPDVSGSSSHETATKDTTEAISPPVPPKRKNAKSAVTQSTDGAKSAQTKVSKPVKPKK